MLALLLFSVLLKRIDTKESHPKISIQIYYLLSFKKIHEQ